MSTIDLPVSEARIGDKYGKGFTITDIEYAGRRDRSQVIFTIKKGQTEKRIRHEMISTYEVDYRGDKVSAETAAMLHEAALVIAVRKAYDVITPEPFKALA